jgi:hypothetical protein
MLLRCVPNISKVQISFHFNFLNPWQISLIDESQDWWVLQYSCRWSTMCLWLIDASGFVQYGVSGDRGSSSPIRPVPWHRLNAWSLPVVSDRRSMRWLTACDGTNWCTKLIPLLNSMNSIKVFDNCEFVKYHLDVLIRFEVSKEILAYSLSCWSTSLLSII